MRASPGTVVDLCAYRPHRRPPLSDVGWDDALSAPAPVAFSLEWLPAWFELVAIVAEERKQALALSQRTRDHGAGDSPTGAASRQ